MSNYDEPLRNDQVTLGPGKVVEVFTAPAPANQPVSESLGNQTVPFEKIKYLISDKPICRPIRYDPPG